MPLFGAHMSAAGGAHNALLIASRFECETVQLFTKNNNQWKGKNLSEEDIAIFKSTLKETKLKFPTAHNSYLINLASPEKNLYRKSIDAFVDEMKRAESLGLSYLVAHPGSRLESSESEALTKIAKAIDEIHSRCPDFKVKILLELTAGQGSSLGHRFEHMTEIFEQIDDHKRLGICLDTCHIFAAGYSLSPEENYERTFSEFDRVIGIKKLKVFHVNDSKKALGSRVDRHEHIGKGFLGLEPFRLLVNDKRFEKLPMILETPKHDSEGNEMDGINLKVLRDLLSN